MGMVLTNPLALGERLGRCGMGMCRARPIGNRTCNREGQRMGMAERVVLPRLIGQGAQGVIGCRGGGVAQIGQG